MRTTLTSIIITSLKLLSHAYLKSTWQTGLSSHHIALHAILAYPPPVSHIVVIIMNRIITIVITRTVLNNVPVVASTKSKSEGLQNTKDQP
jgi:hypothetical protein